MLKKNRLCGIDVATHMSYNYYCIQKEITMLRMIFWLCRSELIQSF